MYPAPDADKRVLLPFFYREKDGGLFPLNLFFSLLSFASLKDYFFLVTVRFRSLLSYASFFSRKRKERLILQESFSPSFLLHLQKKGAKKKNPRSMYARFRSALMKLFCYCNE
jgi:hypothetical protein